MKPAGSSGPTRRSSDEVFGVFIARASAAHFSGCRRLGWFAVTAAEIAARTVARFDGLAAPRIAAPCFFREAGVEVPGL
jgi:hypothetical protein